MDAGGLALRYGDPSFSPPQITNTSNTNSYSENDNALTPLPEESVQTWIDLLNTTRVRNLCDIPGHTACEGNLGVPRNSPWYRLWLGFGPSRMPQLPTTNEELVETIKKNNYRYGHYKAQERIENLIPIQEEMNPHKVAGLLQILLNNRGKPFTEDIRVAKYPGAIKAYVLDGHHRYAAYFIYQMVTGQQTPIPVYKIMMSRNEHPYPLDFVKEVNTWKGVDFHNFALVAAAVGAGGYTFTEVLKKN